MAWKLVILMGLLALALPSAARAETFCVNAPGCPEDRRYDSIQPALAAADAAAGQDRIDVGPGEYAGPFTAGADNSVEIVGAGHGTTVLSATGDATVISLEAPSSAIRGLTVRPGTGIGVRLTGAGAPATLENMTVQITGGDSSTGVAVGPPATTAAATLRHVTIAGAGEGTGLAVRGGAPPAVASAVLQDSAITGVTQDIVISGPDCDGVPPPCVPATATVTSSFSAHDVTPGVIATNGPITDEPRLDDDLRPRHDSPLVDAADPLGGGTTDASGAPRVVDGDGDDTARSDIGALEYQRRPPVIAGVAAVPGEAQVGVPIAFGVQASDPDGEDVTVAWTFSDGTTAVGPAVSKAFQAPGQIVGDVAVTDEAGVVARASVTVNVTSASVPDPPAGTPAPPAPRPRVLARVVPEGLTLRAVRRRDRRAPYRFRLRGRLVLPNGIAATGCANGAVRLAVRAGKRRRTATATLGADCSFRRTLKLGRKRARRVVVTPQFTGTAALTPFAGAPLRLRAG